MQVLILVGGLGTRLRTVVNDRPKPMALVKDKPFLEYIICNLKKQGFSDFILAAGYMHEFIEEYFGDGEKLGVSIKYSIEETQLGTAGAIKNAENLINSDELLILNGDTYFSIDYREMLLQHQNKKADFTIALRNVEDTKRYGTVEFNGDFKITGFIEKGEESTSSYINGGIYIINRSILDEIKEGEFVSLERDVLPKFISRADVYGFKAKGYFIDIGIPEDYIKFCEDVNNNKLK